MGSSLRQSRPRRAVALLGLASLAGAPGLHAQTGPVTPQSLFFSQSDMSRGQNYMEADAGLLYSDNIEQTANGSGGAIGLLGLLGDVGHQGARLDYRLDSDMILLKYLGNQFPTQPYGFAAGSAEYRIVPGFFAWTVHDSYSEYIINQYEPTTPDNTQALNSFLTGPRFTLRPTLRTTVTLTGYYGIVDGNSKSPNYVDVNNRNYGGALTLDRAFSSRLSAYLTGSWEKVEYANSVQNTDYRGASAYTGLHYTNARTYFDASVGYQRLHTTTLEVGNSVIGPIQRQVTQTPSGSTWNLGLSRLIRPTQRVSLHASRQYADASNLFQLGLAQPVPSPTGNLIVSGEPFQYTSYGATWRYEQGRTALQLDLTSNSQDYTNSPSSNTHSKIASGLITRRLSPALSWDFGAYFEHDSYSLNSYNTVNVITSLRWRIGRRFGLRFVYAHSAPDLGYTQNQIGVIAFYTLTPPVLPAAAAEPPPLQPTSPWSMQQPLPPMEPQQANP